MFLPKAVQNHIVVAWPKIVVDLKVGTAHQSINERPAEPKTRPILHGNRLGGHPRIHFTTPRQLSDYSAEALTKLFVPISRNIDLLAPSSSCSG
jgi:hypothetical protein